MIMTEGAWQGRAKGGGARQGPTPSKRARLAYDVNQRNHYQWKSNHATTRLLPNHSAYRSRHLEPQQYHYYSNGTWQHPSTLRESRYSDFVPCTYNEQTLITRLYKYALTLLSQSNIHSLTQRTHSSAAGSRDIEMIASSPSPNLRASPTSPSRTVFQSRTNNGPYRYPVSNSTHHFIKPPSPAAFPRYPAHSPQIAQTLHKRSLSASTKSPPRQTVDAGTQYSPPVAPNSLDLETSRAGAKRKDRSISPEAPPPEPALAPQMSHKRAEALVAPSQPITAASSTTLANSASRTSSPSQGSSPKRARPPKAAAKIMPVKYETCDVRDLVLLISNMLMELVRFNDEIPLQDGKLTRFHSRAPPGISVMDYLQRLTTHATLSPPILLSMVYYIDRLCALYPAFTISSLTVHRFLITSATVASKGLSDSFWTNNTYAKVGGVSLKELALLELEFLWRVEWRIVPKPEVLVDYYRSLVERSEGFEIELEAVEDDSQESGLRKRTDSQV